MIPTLSIPLRFVPIAPPERQGRYIVPAGTPACLIRRKLREEWRAPHSEAAA